MTIPTPAEIARLRHPWRIEGCWACGATGSVIGPDGGEVGCEYCETTGRTAIVPARVLPALLDAAERAQRLDEALTEIAEEAKRGWYKTDLDAADNFRAIEYLARAALAQEGETDGPR